MTLPPHRAAVTHGVNLGFTSNTEAYAGASTAIDSLHVSPLTHVTTAGLYSAPDPRSGIAARSGASHIGPALAHFFGSDFNASVIATQTSTAPGPESASAAERELNDDDQ